MSFSQRAKMPNVLVLIVGVLLIAGNVDVVRGERLPPVVYEFAKFNNADDYLEHDELGKSVSISGNVAVVGAIGDYIYAGLAYVYVFEESGWSLKATLLASDWATYDHFGCSVSISGNYIVVGAYGDDDQGAQSGSAYIFEKPADGWADMTETRKIVQPYGRSTDRFGLSVSISGSYVVVGAPFYWSQFSQQGAAFVWKRYSYGWVYQCPLTAEDAGERDLFGDSVAISGDTIVVGSYRDDDAYSSNVLCNSGSAYVFCRCGSQWEQQAKLLPSTTSCDDEFGSSVAVSGDTVVVGSANDRDNKGYAFVFERPADGWRNMTPTARLFGMGLPADAQFGKSVAVSGDMVVVGVWGDDEKGARSGSACVFKKPECGWSGSMFEIGKLLASDGESGDRLGYSVGVSGSIAVAGAPRVTVYAYPHYWSVGRAYVFHGISDCNANDLLDTSELSPGTDCNANNVLDECEVFYPGDLNGDGVLNLGDYSNFHECVTDPCESPPCEPRLYEDPCCAPADIDSDGDVDLLDFAALQTLLAKR